MLLGPEFQSVEAAGPKEPGCSPPDSSGPIELKPRRTALGVSLSSAADDSETPLPRDWILVPFSAKVKAEIETTSSVCVSIPTANGGKHIIEMDSNCVKRIVGCPEERSLAWLDDDAINCFMSLLTPEAYA